MPRAHALDESQFPLIYVHYYDIMDDAEFEDSLLETQRLLDGNRPFALVLQTHHNRMMPMHQLKRQAEHGKQTYDQAKRLVRGIAMVIPSPVIRGVLKVSLKLAPMAAPYAIFDDIPAADAWARAKLGMPTKLAK